MTAHPQEDTLSRQPTSQERARSQLPHILADIARRLGLEPASETMETVLYLLQDAYGLPTGRRFTLYAHGPRCRTWGEVAPQAAHLEQEPEHEFRDTVLRLTRDLQGMDIPGLTLCAKLVYANRYCKLQSMEQAQKFILELSPHIPEQTTRETWTMLYRRGIIRTPEQSQEPGAEE